MSLARASVWTASSTLIKIVIGLLVVKLLAVAFGPTGVGQAGNFRQLITVLGLLSGAGIFNGITKYVAESQHQPAQLKTVIGTSSSVVFGCSALLAVFFVIAARPISIVLFNSTEFVTVIQALALIQMGIASSNLFLAILKGFRDARGNALSVIIGSLLGCVAYIVCFMVGGYIGALIGLALVPALLLLPAGWWLLTHHSFSLSMFKFQWDNELVVKLSKFTAMALITTVSIPFAYVMMRNLLAKDFGWHEVGIWQGVSSISDAYLQFITASFTVYLLPTLAKLIDKQQITQEIKRALLFVLPAVAVASCLIWLLRDIVITVLFSTQFTAMRPLFAWQLIGDVLKVGSYVFGYLVIAKASLRLYILAELSQFVFLTSFSHWLIPLHGALGASQAYMLTYICHFILCGMLFIFYYQRR